MNADGIMVETIIENNVIQMDDLLSRIQGLVQQARDGSERESLQLNMNLIIQVHGPDGKLKQEQVLHNLICTAGKNKLLAVSGGTALNTFVYIAIGTGATAAAIGDTTLGTEVARSPAQTPTNPTAPVYQVVYIFPAGTGTGAITEVGLLDASSGGNLLARQVFGVVTKGATDTMTVQWQIS